jgi:hypothetical protein
VCCCCCHTLQAHPQTKHAGKLRPLPTACAALLCSPNAVNYTLRDSMVVRAAGALPAGTELCINYLGRGALRSLSQRQLELEACYGFKCGCDRWE